MSKSNPQEDREKQILAYLLGECEAEDSFEVEKMCREDPEWQREKIRLGQTVGLVEEALSCEPVETIPDDDRKLNENQRLEIKTILLNAQKEASSLEGEQKIMTNQKKKTNRITYWVPLAAAAAAAVIAYWGKPPSAGPQVKAVTDKNSTRGENAPLMSETTAVVQKDPLPEITEDKTLALNSSVPATISKETESALQDAISDGANQILAKRTFKEVKDLEEGLDKNLPSGKEVVEQSKASSSIQQNESGVSLPIDGNRTEKSPESIAFLTAKAKSTALQKNNQGSWNEVYKNPEESFIFNEKGDSLGKVKILESAVDGMILERANWPNKNRKFELEPGSYQIRLTRKGTGTLIIGGRLEKLEENRYRLINQEAWELNKEEQRKPLSMEQLVP